jgi:hypothetical protein
MAAPEGAVRSGGSNTEKLQKLYQELSLVYGEL